MDNKFLLDFNKSRTPFFKSLAYLLIESILPGLAIWFTIGYDFAFSMAQKLPFPNVGYVSLICFCYFIYTFLITLFFYLIKAHESDNFTFALTVSLIFICITLFGSFIKNKGMWILAKFVFILLITFIFLPLFVFISIAIRNLALKKQEDLEKALEAYKNGEIIPDKKLLKAQRYQEYLLKKQKKQKELELFKAQLNRRLDEELKQREEEKIIKIKNKLDEKEEKKRKKEKN